MAIRCPKCGYENVSGSLICAKCYTLFVAVNITETSTTILPGQAAPERNTGNTGVIAPTAAPPRKVTAPLQGDTIALRIAGHGQPLVLHVSTQAILGRYSPHSLTQPRVDLSPYGAFEKGISRMHAAIRRVPDGFTVEDMASSNGTFLNGSRLQPYIATPLASGDKLRLSQLEIEILIGEVSHVRQVAES